MLRVADLEVRYGSVAAVRGVSLEVREGEVVCLIGPNGAGKTTTLLTVAGLLRPAGGRIEFLGHKLSSLAPDRIVRLGIGLVPEGRWILGEMTVHDNLLMGAYVRRDDRARVQEDLETVYGIFPILRARTRQRAGTLSGGEQQMLAIARTLMGRPKLLMMDEPSLGLAPLIIEEIFRVIRELHARGTTILLVEQNAHQALAVAQRAYVMEVGRVTLSGSAAELREHEVLKKAYLGARAGRA
ncbi:MAG: ABC transporter ATP-binding protein [Candidatus Rokubacteria bacterium]|nr:ABC transporter ATP-binding protein [Candidatus Rokubacteria bacterium]